ncbi:LCP family protein [Streptomyces beihaiensis]|uniref:LCP family protein n=1 Tax=Streptomyces beihaiensis TaxID=2984495 RepID=A0ABT3U6U5_9ACTN|nr:LCP family protein [Streptomyces beihaiensis]MCX3063925.1 LCP family protein [Streptomyces beihaiensis]
MTDSAGPPEPTPLGPGTGSSPTGAWRGRRRRRWLRYSAVGAAFVVLVTAGAGWIAYEKLNGNITEDTAAADELARYDKERPTVLVAGAQNLLIIGSDSRAGANAKYGRNDGTQRSDTTILLHVAADRKSATALSIPRDLMVHVPSCGKPGGGRTEPMFVMFNSAFELGGSACTIRTVEKLTGIRINHHMIVDFQGFKKMVDAVDGVQVCLAKPIDDKDAHLKLPAGRQTLNGEQALGYVRARKTLGNGSDTERMDRQQRFLGALIQKVQSNGVLLNPAKLYPVLDAATSSLTTDPGLASLHGLYDLVRGLRGIPADRIQFLTVPREPYVYNANRDQLVQPAADQLFARLRADEPVVVAKTSPARHLAGSDTAYQERGENRGQDQYGDSDSDSDSGNGNGNGNGNGSYVDSYDGAYDDAYDDSYDDGKPLGPSDSPSPSPAPTFRGNTAAQKECG